MELQPRPRCALNPASVAYSSRERRRISVEPERTGRQHDLLPDDVVRFAATSRQAIVVDSPAAVGRRDMRSQRQRLHLDARALRLCDIVEIKRILGLNGASDVAIAAMDAGSLPLPEAIG